MNQVAVLETSAEHELAKMLGNDAPALSSRTPRLKNLRDIIDENGDNVSDYYFNFYVTDQDEAVYAKTVTLRVLSQDFQYRHWDPSQEKLVNKTILTKRMKDEFRDQKGTVRCGRPLSRHLKGMSEGDQNKYKDIKVYRQLRGVVTYDGHTANGSERRVENLPVIFELGGSNFMNFEEEVENKKPRGSRLFEFNIEVSYQQKKTGTVTYPVFQFSPDLKNRLETSDEIIETMKVFASQISVENNQIEKQYLEARRGADLNDMTVAAVDGVVVELDDDFNGE
jgi:hypothetical protein